VSATYTVVLPAGAPREEWLAARRATIGASEVSAALGISPWSDALSLYVDKTEPAADEGEPADHLAMGLDLEPGILRAYQRRSGRTARASGALLRSVAHPWLSCTLDAWVDHPSGVDVPLELKTSSGDGSDWSDGPPPHYRAQLQAQMLVTGSPRASIAVLLARHRLLWCDVEADRGEQRAIIDATRDLWGRIERRDPPAPSGASSLPALRSMYAPEREQPGEVELSADLGDVLREITERKAAARQLQADIERLETLVWADLRYATAGRAPNGYSVTLTSRTMPERTVRASTSRVMRVNAPKENRK
jgi:putative phage-type endonuclease